MQSCKEKHWIENSGEEMWLGGLTQNFLDDDDTQKLPNLVSSIPFMQDDVEHVSYHIESLLQIFRWQKQATTILNKSAFKKKLMTIC